MILALGTRLCAGRACQARRQRALAVRVCSALEMGSFSLESLCVPRVTELTGPASHSTPSRSPKTTPYTRDSLRASGGGALSRNAEMDEDAPPVSSLGEYDTNESMSSLYPDPSYVDVVWPALRQSPTLLPSAEDRAPFRRRLRPAHTPLSLTPPLPPPPLPKATPSTSSASPPPPSISSSSTSPNSATSSPRRPAQKEAIGSRSPTRSRGRPLAPLAGTARCSAEP